MSNMYYNFKCKHICSGLLVTVHCILQHAIISPVYKPTYSILSKMITATDCVAFKITQLCRAEVLNLWSVGHK